MNLRRIILTDLNPSVYKQEYLSSFLSELVIHSLLYDQVLIREGDLICNRHLTNLLRDQEAFQIFAELLKAGAIRLLRVSPDSLFPDLRCDPIIHPLSARAEDHMRRRSYRGRPWKPKSWEVEIFSRLDPIIIDSNANVLQSEFPIENGFAAELKAILSSRKLNHLKDHRAFRDITDRMADKFMSFCTDQEEWVRFLHKKGMKSPLINSERGFYRTAGYQCLEFFKHRNGMRRLIESTYAACECNRENAEGRYGRSALAELPFAYESAIAQHEAAETIMKMELVASGSQMQMVVAPGIGEVVAVARTGNAFREFQDVIRSLPSADSPERAFSVAWDSLCSVVADQWSRKLVRRAKVDERVRNICLGVYLSVRALGFVVFHGRGDLDWPIVADFAAINRIEHWVPALSQSIRATVKLPKIHKQLTNAATLRCSKISIVTTSMPMLSSKVDL